MRFVHSRAREATTHTTASPIPNMDDPSGETSFAFEVPRRFIAGFVHIPAPEQQNGGNTDGLQLEPVSSNPVVNTATERRRVGDT